MNRITDRSDSRAFRQIEREKVRAAHESDASTARLTGERRGVSPPVGPSIHYRPVANWREELIGGKSRRTSWPRIGIPPAGSRHAARRVEC